MCVGGWRRTNVPGPGGDGYQGVAVCVCVCVCVGGGVGGLCGNLLITKYALK